MRSQPDLLELRIKAWNPIDGKFIIWGQDIKFDSTDIYFSTKLSRRGERPILEGQQPGGDSLDMSMAQVCPRGQRTRSGKVEIPTMDDIILCSMLFIVTWVVRSQAQHEASKTHLWLALECLNPTMFNWAKTLTTNIKRQLTNCRHREMKQFGYGSILVSLMLEQVPTLQLHDMDLDLRRPCEMRATR